MGMYDIILKKRRGLPLTEGEIRGVIADYTAGVLPDYQMAALAMAICFSGMSREETAVLTDAIARSGDTVDLSRLGDVSVDKHSTGGVGDKTTLVVAPIVAALGGKLAKMTGRGLGHTGGTADKLSTIPGFRIDLSREEFLAQADAVGVAVIGQTADLAPADKKLYALRDVTATVDSLPLIVSSIMGKKLAAGARSIVLDVKVGSGSFNRTMEEARPLAQAMLDIGKACGRRTAAIITNMDLPLGMAVGNALEVREAIALLRGEDVPDLREVCLALAANMLALAQSLPLHTARRAAQEALDSGMALAKFRQWVAAQGGDPRVADDPALLPRAAREIPVYAPRAGYIRHMDTQAIGRLCVGLGAGRETADAAIDPGAGIIFSAKTGACVRRGDLIATLYTDLSGLEKTGPASLLSALTLGDEAPEPQPMIYETLGGTDRV